MSLEKYHEEHNERQEQIQGLSNTLEQRKKRLLQQKEISEEQLKNESELVNLEIDNKAEIAEHVDDRCLLDVVSEMKSAKVDLPVERKKEMYEAVEALDAKVIQARIDAKDKIKNLLKTEMPVSGTVEFRERQKAVFDDINQRASNVQIDEFTYFEELDEYIDRNPLFKENDKINANIALDRIKDKNPRIELNLNKYIDEIKSNLKTKNLFRSYLMINRLVGQKETSITNSLSKVLFEDIVIKSKNALNIFDIDIFNNSDIQKYLEEEFNPEDYKQNYKDFTKEKLLIENKNNTKKYIKIYSFVNSKQWDELWESII